MSPEPHDPGPPRVRVTGPPRRRSRPETTGTSGATGVPRGAETPLGGLYVGSLLRAQRQQAVRLLVLLVLTVGSLPLVFAVFPGLVGVQVAGVPLAWLLVGGATYPVLLGLGWWHLRRAERIEQDYLDLLGREGGP